MMQRHSSSARSPSSSREELGRQDAGEIPENVRRQQP
jgi:hypothetical protein